jgi:hypothetical protein
MSFKDSGEYVRYNLSVRLHKEWFTGDLVEAEQLNHSVMQKRRDLLSTVNRKSG